MRVDSINLGKKRLYFKNIFVYSWIDDTADLLHWKKDSTTGKYKLNNFYEADFRGIIKLSKKLIQKAFERRYDFDTFEIDLNDKKHRKAIKEILDIFNLEISDRYLSSRIFIEAITKEETFFVEFYMLNKHTIKAVFKDYNRDIRNKPKVKMFYIVQNTPSWSLYVKDPDKFENLTSIAIQIAHQAYNNPYELGYYRTININRLLKDPSYITNEKTRKAFLECLDILSLIKTTNLIVQVNINGKIYNVIFENRDRKYFTYAPFEVQ